MISARTFSGCALSATDGSVHCFGLDDFESDKPTGNGFSELAVADNDACVLKTGEVPICWSSQGPGLELTNVPTVPVHGLIARRDHRRNVSTGNEPDHGPVAVRAPRSALSAAMGSSWRTLLSTA